jgi:hypothetical protein
MKTRRLRSVSLFSVPFRSALFSCAFETPASTKAGAIRAAMASEPFAPRRCFGTPRRLRVIHRATVRA